MVRAVDLAMTVRAAPVEKTARLWRIIRSVTGVTLGAEPRQAHFEQAVVDGTVGFMAIGTIVRSRGMLMKEGTSPFRMAGITVLIDARLLELRRIWRAVRIVAIRTGNLSFLHGHVGRAHQLRFSLQMALPAYFRLRSFVEERRFVADFGKLIAVTGLFHYRVAVDAGDAAARVRARFPVGLRAALVALETRLVLNFGGLSGIFAEIDKPADASAPSRSHVITSRTVTGFARLLLAQSARVE